MNYIQIIPTKISQTGGNESKCFVSQRDER